MIDNDPIRETDALWMLQSKLQQFKAKLLRYKKLRSHLEARILKLETEIAIRQKEDKLEKRYKVKDIPQEETNGTGVAEETKPDLPKEAEEPVKKEWTPWDED